MFIVLKIYGEGRHLHSDVSFCLLLHQRIQKHMRFEAGDGPGKGYLCSALLSPDELASGYFAGPLSEFHLEICA